GYLWSRYAGRKLPKPIIDDEEELEVSPHKKLPSLVQALLPVVVPIILIGAHAFIGLADGEMAGWLNVVYVLGFPEVALSVGILLALSAKKNWKGDELNPLLRSSVEKAGEILVIIGAGGAFGAILAQADLGQHFAGSNFIG